MYVLLMLPYGNQHIFYAFGWNFLTKKVGKCGLVWIRLACTVFSINKR